MAWYYNNEGDADGPHEDDVMEALASQRKVTGGTLVSKAGSGEWGAVEEALPSWWKPAPAVFPPAPAARGPKPAALPEQALPARLQPVAPMRGPELGKPAQKPGFFTRLFGKGSSKD